MVNRASSSQDEADEHLGSEPNDQVRWKLPKERIRRSPNVDKMELKAVFEIMRLLIRPPSSAQTQVCLMQHISTFLAENLLQFKDMQKW